MSKIVLFDLDDTLYDYEKAHEAGLQQAFLIWNKNKKPMEYQEFTSLYSDGRAWIKKFLADTAASHSRALYFQKLVEIATGKPNTDLITALLDGYYKGFFESMKLFPGVSDVLTKLKDLDYKLGIVTNMQANIQYKKLTLLGIGNKFDCIVTSESVGHEKPNPLIFFHTLALMKGIPQKTFMVGDSLQNDIEPAAFIGINPIWFNPRNKSSSLSKTINYMTITEYSQLLSKITLE